MSLVVMEDGEKSVKGSKLLHYCEKVGTSVFVAINENIYCSGDVQITIQKMEDEDETFGIYPTWVEYIKDWLAYEGFVGIGEEKDIGGGLTFGIANVKRSYEKEQLEIFEDGIILPETYRGGDVALDIYKCMIDFAQRKGVKRINSDCDLTPGSASIYERLKLLGYKISQNPSATWYEKGKRMKSTDGLPNYTIEL